MTKDPILPKRLSIQSEYNYSDKRLSSSSSSSSFSSSNSNSKLSVEQDKIRYITVPEAIGLDFNSFIPQADITSQVHFISNIQIDSQASLAGLKDGDRILQVNGINVTNLEHEDVRKLMQLMTPIIFTVAHDPKYLLLLQQPITDIEEKEPEPLIVLDKENNYDPKIRRASRFELRRYSTISSISNSIKSHRCEILYLTESNREINEEPLKAKLCRLHKSKSYDGYGLVLKHQQHLHLIGEVEKASPSYRSGLRVNDVIIFVGKTNVEKMTHDDIKIMMRAMELTSNHVDLTVLAKTDIPKYRTLKERGLIDWAIIELNK